MSYFRRVSEDSYRANAHAGGAWNAAEQHIAPSFGLLAYAIEADREARGELVEATMTHEGPTWMPQPCLTRTTLASSDDGATAVMLNDVADARGGSDGASAPA